MEWRDVAMGFVTISITLFGFSVLLLKNMIMENRRNIGELYSKVHDEEIKRLEANIKMLETQNANQRSLLDSLSQISARLAKEQT